MMENCEFSPQVVRDIAKNILSFLQSKATKEGHTYWLFKGEHDALLFMYFLIYLLWYCFNVHDMFAR